MCTAATYLTGDFYFGRTLDYEFSYGDEVTITPRNYPFHFRSLERELTAHYAMIGMAHVAGGLSPLLRRRQRKGLMHRRPELRRQRRTIRSLSREKTMWPSLS